MNEPHELTEEFIREARAREELTRIDRELSRLPEPLTPTQYLTRRKALLAAEDFAGLTALDRECAVTRLRRAASQKRQQELHRKLDVLRGKASGHPTPATAQEHKGAVSTFNPGAQKPGFVEPTILALREAALAPATTVKPVPQQEQSPTPAIPHLLPMRNEEQRRQALETIRARRR